MANQQQHILCEIAEIAYLIFNMNHNRVKASLLGLGVMGLFSCFYYVYSTYSSRKGRQNHDILSEKSYQKHFYRIITDLIKHQPPEKKLTINFIQEIFKAQYLLAELEFGPLICQARKRRRSAKDKADYASIVFSTEKQLEELHQKCLDAILAYFNIERSHWIQAVKEWVQESEESTDLWQKLVFDCERKEENMLIENDAKPMSYKEIIKVMEYKTEILKKLKKGNLDLTKSIDQTSEYCLIETYVKDQVYRKFHLQEELLQFSIKQLNNNQRKSLNPFVEAINDLTTAYLFGIAATLD